MFDNLDFENSKLIKNKSGNDFFADKPVSGLNSQKSELASEVTQELHSRLMGFYRQKLDRQAQNRYEMAIDEDYYDNIQWDDESALFCVNVAKHLWFITLFQHRYGGFWVQNVKPSLITRFYQDAKKNLTQPKRKQH